jgi:hypothetical protein
MKDAHGALDVTQLTADQGSIVVLARTGRLAGWDLLSAAERDAASNEHVELMLAVARAHQLMTLDGYRLIGPQQRFERLWVIEFPELAGAEAWIEAEMRPPYGRYGFYEYDLARRFATGFSASLVASPPPAMAPRVADPAAVPPLSADHSSVAGLMFARLDAEAGSLDAATRGDDEHLRQLRAAADAHQLLRMEGFQLLGPRNDWHRAWIVLFPQLAGVEAWIDAELTPPLNSHGSKSFLLARRWQPDYFSSWVPTAGTAAANEK